MLSDEDIEKLCHGRIVYVKGLYQSDESDATEPHYAVMVDSDEAIKEHDTYFVVCISNNDTRDAFRLPVPPRTGLTGWFQCSWKPEVHLPGIISVHPVVLSVPEMIALLKLVRQADAARLAKKKRTQK